MEKQISIVVAASGEIKDIALSEGATVRDVLNEASLQGYQLSRKGGEVMDPNTDLYSEAMDSEKLYATPEDVSVGGGGSASPSGFKTLIRKISDFLYVRSVEGHWQRYRSNASKGAFKKKEPGL